MVQRLWLLMIPTAEMVSCRCFRLVLAVPSGVGPGPRRVCADHQQGA
jgi:hypothetical protein